MHISAHRDVNVVGERGRSHKTSAPRVGSKADYSTDRLREWDSDMRGGVQKSKISADIVGERQERTAVKECGNLA